jgi:hypothetical protein
MRTSELSGFEVVAGAAAFGPPPRTLGCGPARSAHELTA